MWLLGKQSKSKGSPVEKGRGFTLSVLYIVMYGAFIAPMPLPLLALALIGALGVREIFCAMEKQCSSTVSLFFRRLSMLGATCAPWVWSLGVIVQNDILTISLAVAAMLLPLGVWLLRPRRWLPAWPSIVFGAIAGLNAFALLLQMENGPKLCLFAFFMINIADSAAYFCGKLFGNRSLIPKISPGKTLEGSIGSILISVATGFLFASVLHLSFVWWQVVGASLLLNILSQLGDMTLSIAKRELGAKDFGTLLPGHGGILDRFDSCLLAVPAFYILIGAF